MATRGVSDSALRTSNHCQTDINHRVGNLGKFLRPAAAPDPEVDIMQPYLTGVMADFSIEQAQEGNVAK